MKWINGAQQGIIVDRQGTLSISLMETIIESFIGQKELKKDELLWDVTKKEKIHLIN